MRNFGGRIDAKYYFIEYALLNNTQVGSPRTVRVTVCLIASLSKLFPLLSHCQKEQSSHHPKRNQHGSIFTYLVKDYFMVEHHLLQTPVTSEKICDGFPKNTLVKCTNALRRCQNMWYQCMH